MENHDKDLIVSGGGLSGLSTAITAAGKDMSVLVLERAEKLGVESAIDELAYPHALKYVLADYRDRKDLFIPLSKRAFWIMTPDAHMAWECVSTPRDDGSTGYIVDRPAFDFALKDRLEALGGEIITGAEVSSFERNDNGFFTGVITESGDAYHAPLTVIAEGPVSMHANHLLDRERLQLSDGILIVKEVLTGTNPLPSQRLTGSSLTGASIILLGDPLQIGFSWGRLIAYRDKLIVKAYLPADRVSERQSSRTFIEKLKMHPSIEPIVRGLEHDSFLTSIVPVAGFEKYPDILWGDGYLLTGKSARLYHPFDCRMTDYSIVSGAIAGWCASAARSDHRPSRPTEYPRALADSFIMQDRNSMASFMNSMREKKQFGTAYPEIMVDLIDGIFTQDSRTKRMKKTDIERKIRSKSHAWNMVSDFFNLVKLYG